MTMYNFDKGRKKGCVIICLDRSTINEVSVIGVRFRPLKIFTMYLALGLPPSKRLPFQFPFGGDHGWRTVAPVLALREKNCTTGCNPLDAGSLPLVVGASQKLQHKYYKTLGVLQSTTEPRYIEIVFPWEHRSCRDPSPVTKWPLQQMKADQMQKEMAMLPVANEELSHRPCVSQATKSII